MQLRGLDEQLAVSQRSLAAYGESVRLFELQFQYGQVSEMTVEQARTQYETAAAAIPDIQEQIIQTENALSLLLGRNPGPIPRGKTIHELVAPAVPAGLPSDLLAQRPDVLQAEENLIARERAYRRGPGAVFSDDLPYRRVRQGKRRTAPTV